ncbi:4-hydroxy-tetrahydrodipicolinate synthase [Gallaecimonas sp. GXIMD4217]|uniref:4-hydroxy-tetrahydrodipicolinate synthase n=1 Tax=Gallaecimonas sp. GXIMD4217 TaxID=3131927 RepID=UPI00311B3E8A
MFAGSAVALITPMDAEGNVDYSALEALVEWHITEGTQAIVAMGTTGESATLSEAEHLEVVKQVVKAAAGRVPVLAGNGGSSTRGVLALTEKLNALGIDGLLTATPAYNKPPQAGLIAHYRALEAISDTPIILYNVPGRTAVDMTADTVASLAELPGIVGIKEATGDLARLADIRALVGDDFLLLSGDDATSRAFMLAGGHGVISVTANVAPGLFAQMCEKALAGDLAGAEAVDRRIQGLHRALFIESNPIPAKWALKRLGKIESDMLRLPLLPLSPNGQAAVEAALKQAALI